MNEIRLPQRYITLAASAEIRLEVKKSIFIGWAEPVNDGQEAERILQRARMHFPDAAHHVSAWRAGAGTDQQVERYSDDGEPSGTAGLPVLNVLKGQEIVNACLIVTRYFGGTLLGTGGLVHAYGEAAADAVSQAGLRQMILSRSWKLTLPYGLYTPYTRLCASRGWQILDTQFQAEVDLVTAVPVSESELFQMSVRDLSLGSSAPEEMELAYFPFDYQKVEEE